MKRLSYSVSAIVIGVLDAEPLQEIRNRVRVADDQHVALGLP